MRSAVMTQAEFDLAGFKALAANTRHPPFAKLETDFVKMRDVLVAQLFMQRNAGCIRQGTAADFGMHASMAQVSDKLSI